MLGRSANGAEPGIVGLNQLGTGRRKDPSSAVSTGALARFSRWPPSLVVEGFVRVAQMKFRKRRGASPRVQEKKPPGARTERYGPRRIAHINREVHRHVAQKTASNLSRCPKKTSSWTGFCSLNRTADRTACPTESPRRTRKILQPQIIGSLPE